MTENEYQEHLVKILRTEEGFCNVYKYLSEAFSKCNTNAPKKIIRNDLALAVIELYKIGEVLNININEGVELISNEMKKENKND